ncbi:hypothetical protein E2562_033118 [Oryza meyeriana var. granulata]|uniref:Uncharacterized protein n=1 Tax=Oryza meyeriana var. granulata TaxID=110450 RepID=A0A6G1CKC4_9ORYZ|nr:hypothetical protein E2562_033118 [Oryza meyeriana var. granulata]
MMPTSPVIEQRCTPFPLPRLASLLLVMRRAVTVAYKAVTPASPVLLFHALPDALAHGHVVLIFFTIRHYHAELASLLFFPISPPQLATTSPFIAALLCLTQGNA